MSFAKTKVKRRPFPATDTSATRWRDLVPIVLWPFLQLGITFYASIALLLAILVLLRLRGCIMPGLTARPWSIALLPFLFISPIFYHGIDPAQDWLRIGREVFVALLYIAIITGSSIKPILVDEKSITKHLLIFSAAITALTLMQFFALRSGIYLGFPREYYVQGAATIPSELALRYSRLRPAATYSEPSYLAFMMLSVLLVAYARRSAFKQRKWLVFLALTCGALSQAASFAVFAALLSIVFLFTTTKNSGQLLLFTGCIVGVALLLILGSELGMVSRLLGGLSASGDMSIFSRIFGPALALPSYLMDHPLGESFAVLPRVLLAYTEYLGIDSENYLMNGLFNLFFEFGILGLPLLISLILTRDLMIRAYLVSCMMFNGAFLSIDKLAVVGLTIAVYEAIRRQSAGAANPASSPRSSTPGGNIRRHAGIAYGGQRAMRQRGA